MNKDRLREVFDRYSRLFVQFDDQEQRIIMNFSQFCAAVSELKEPAQECAEKDTEIERLRGANNQLESDRYHAQANLEIAESDLARLKGEYLGTMELVLQWDVLTYHEVGITQSIIKRLKTE